MFNIFESPWALTFSGVLVLLFVMVYRQSRPDKQRFWQLLVPFAFVSAGFGINYAVQTDYEKIESVINASIAAVVSEDIERIGELVSPAYSDGVHSSKDELMMYCRSILSYLEINKAKQRYNINDIDGTEATSETEVFTHLALDGGYGENMIFVKMKIYLGKTSERRWLITSSEILALNNQPMSWKKAASLRNYSK